MQHVELLGLQRRLDLRQGRHLQDPHLATTAGQTGHRVQHRPRGVRARSGAFGGTGSLLFLHGRGQEGRNPNELRRSWTAGLNEGLTLAGLGTIDPADVYFPFYGDRLVEGLAAHESILGEGETGGLYERIVAEAAAQAGMPTEQDMEPEIAGNTRFR